jgi:hypothetical protein
MYNSKFISLLLKCIIHTNQIIHLYRHTRKVDKKYFMKLWDVVSHGENSKEKKSI